MRLGKKKGKQVIQYEILFFSSLHLICVIGQKSVPSFIFQVELNAAEWQRSISIHNTGSLFLCALLAGQTPSHSSCKLLLKHMR